MPKRKAKPRRHFAFKVPRGVRVRGFDEFPCQWEREVLGSEDRRGKAAGKR